MEILSLSQISPDQVILWQWGVLRITATLLYTWFIMGILVFGSWLVTRNISSDVRTSRWQSLLAFIGTLFLFVGLSNLLLIVPGYVAPTSSLTTTAALAICVFIAVPLFGITKQGIKTYFKEYFQPTFIFFPFHVMGEVTRTLALAVRLFGNMMSHDKVLAILLAVTPLFFPIIMHALGLLIGLVQAYIFAILAMVYIASATQAHEEKGDKGAPE
jgi:F-type H+-transporting ATPase subunit a